MHLLWNQQIHEVLQKLWTERWRCDQSNFSLDEAPAVRASPISLYTSPFSRSLRGTAIFQITKYPSYNFLSKSGNGCWKQDDQGQTFLRGTELVNRCQIWQSWHNWGGESTKRPVEASYRPRCEKCFHFPPKLLIFFTLVTPICSTNMSHFPRPWSSFTPHWFKHFGLSQAQHPRIYFQTRLLSDCKRKAISGPRLDRNNGQLQLLFGPCPLPKPIAQASSSSSAFRGFPIGESPITPGKAFSAHIH